MKHRDFKVGEAFFTAAGGWMCVDKGSKTVIAYKLTPKSVKEKSWDLQDNVIFYEYDLGGCDRINNFVEKTKEEKSLEKAIKGAFKPVSQREFAKNKKEMQKAAKQTQRDMKSMSYRCSVCNNPKKDTGVWVVHRRNTVKACQKCSRSLPRAKQG